MIDRRLFGCLASAALMLAAQPSGAGSMRCGTHIIQDGGRSGPGKYEVLKKCGQPTYREGNTWVYDRGQERKVFKFNDSGLLHRIHVPDI